LNIIQLENIMLDPSSLVGRVALRPEHNTKAKIVRNVNFMLPHQLKRCDAPCFSCGALHWKEELSVVDLFKKDPSFSACCQKKKVTLPMFQDSAPGYPLSLQGLFTKSDEGVSSRVELVELYDEVLNFLTVSRNFQALLRMYNNLVSFTSLGARVDRSVQGHYGINIFRVRGGMTHMISSIEPLNEDQPGVLQIFVVGKGGTQEAIYRARVAAGDRVAAARGPTIMPCLVKYLMDFLCTYNPYAWV
jgi:hypothetical protein